MRFIQCSISRSVKTQSLWSRKMIPKSVIIAMVRSTWATQEKYGIAITFFKFSDFHRHRVDSTGRFDSIHRSGDDSSDGWSSYCGKPLWLWLLSSKSTSPSSSSPPLRRQSAPVLLLRELVQWILQRLLQRQVRLNRNQSDQTFYYFFYLLQVTIVPEMNIHTTNIWYSRIRQSQQ